MGEIDHAEDAVDHAEPDADEGVEEPEDEPVGDVLQEFVQADMVLCSPSALDHGRADVSLYREAGEG